MGWDDRCNEETTGNPLSWAFAWLLYSWKRRVVTWVGQVEDIFPGNNSRTILKNHTSRNIYKTAVRTGDLETIKVRSGSQRDFSVEEIYKNLEMDEYWIMPFQKFFESICWLLLNLGTCKKFSSYLLRMFVKIWLEKKKFALEISSYWKLQKFEKFKTISQTSEKFSRSKNLSYLRKRRKGRSGKLDHWSCDVFFFHMMGGFE